MILNSEYEVLTKNGFKDFVGIKKTAHSNNIKIYTEDSNIIVTTKHRFYCGKNKLGKIFRTAEKIKVGNKVDNKIVTKIENNVECSNNFYDLMEVQDGHEYITSGITSHNCAFIRNNLWEELKDSVFPTQDSLAVHQTLLSSTSRGYNQWYYLVKHARLNKNGYKITECDWKEVPRWNRNGTRKDPELFKKETVDSKGYLYFSQNFENNFLGSADTMISTQALQNIEPIEPIYNKYINGLRVFEVPKKNHNYIVSVDPTKDGIDAFSLHVTDVTSLPFIQVAAADLQVDYLSMTQELDSLGQTYNNAFMIIENNEGAGQSINDSLWSTYEYDNLYKDRQPDDPKKYKKYKGFRTTTKSRQHILNLLKIFLENDKLIINDENTLYELQNFIKQDNGKFSADEGFKDDLVMSLAIMFAPLMNIRGFENQKKFLEEMFGVMEEDIEQKTGFDELFSFGSFEDGTELDDIDDYHQTLIDKKYQLDSSGEIPLVDFI